MHNKPLVSVIITFLNEADFIEEAIESVFAQTYEKWELLLVDDGSTDASTEIAVKYAEEDPNKVKYLEHDQHQNRGISASRNLGIRNSHGELVAFLDSDDVWLPEKLERQVSILGTHRQAGMVYGPALIWHEWKGNPDSTKRNSIQELGVQANKLFEPPTLIHPFLRDDGFTPCPSSIMVRRNILNSVGGFEEAFATMYDDQVFCAKMCLRVPVYVSNKSWFRYRRHSESLCSVALKDGGYHRYRSKFLTWFEEYLIEHRYNNGRVWGLVQKELRPYRHPVRDRMVNCFLYPVKLSRRLVRFVVRRLGVQATVPNHKIYLE